MAIAAALHRSAPMTIEPAWIDYNGHLNMAYYNVLFDRAVDQFLLDAGLGPDYVRHSQCSYMCVEAHICYLRELFQRDPVIGVSRVLDVDDKRLHVFVELRHAQEDWVSATSEMMFLHTDLQARRVSVWPPALRDRLDALKRTSDGITLPDRAGRRIAIPRQH